MAKTTNFTAIVSIIAGIVVLAKPEILAWVIGLYLIIAGVLALAK